jgi:cytochrome b involved in lipid metabolism
MSSDLETGVHDDSESTTETVSSQDQIEKIRIQVAKLQGIERGISRSSRKLTVDKADSPDGTARTVDSLHFLRREPSQKSVDPDATVIKIRDEVRRLQHRQQELAGGSKSSRTLQTSASSMSLTPEQFEKQQKYARNKKHCAIAVGVLILAGVVAGIVSLVSSLQDKNVSFISKEKGGDVPLTLQEVALHATTDDCWASIHGNVYDLTDWVNDHPGGSIYIQSICGKDGTDLYSAQHPTLWLKVYVADYRIGPLVAATVSATEAPQATTDAPVSSGITLDEVALHNTSQDIWVALYGNVYDLTQWATIHRGGSQNIINLAGTDGTARFARQHSKSYLMFIEASMLGPLAA